MHIILKCIAPNLMEFDAPLVLISMHHASNMEPDRTLSWPYHYLQLLDLSSSALWTVEYLFSTTWQIWRESSRLSVQVGIILALTVKPLTRRPLDRLFMCIVQYHKHYISYIHHHQSLDTIPSFVLLGMQWE